MSASTEGLRGKSQSITVDDRVRVDKEKGKNGENGQIRLDWVRMILWRETIGGEGNEKSERVTVRD